MFFRVFGSSAEMPESADVLAHLTSRFASVSGSFDADGSGWYQAEFVVDGVALWLERYLAEEAGIRAELNAWAAWLETRAQEKLMERIIQTAQLFTLQTGEITFSVREICMELCRYLALRTDGICQIDGSGLFAASGELLVAEEPTANDG